MSTPIIKPVQFILEHLSEFKQAVKDGDISLSASMDYCDLISEALQSVKIQIIAKGMEVTE